MRDGKPYCLHCFDAMFAEYCDYCGEPIGVDQGQMSHDGQHWHATDQCFACSTCRCSLLGRPFLPRRGAIYCSIACSKGEPPTPSDSSGPGLRTPRQKVMRPPAKVPSDNETATPPGSPRRGHLPLHHQPQTIDSSPAPSSLPSMSSMDPVISNPPPPPPQQQQIPSHSANSALRSPKMGKRVLQSSPKHEPMPHTNLTNDLSAPSVIKGLDRVLLERNLEKLLVEKTMEVQETVVVIDESEKSNNDETGIDMVDLVKAIDQATQFPPPLKAATENLKLNLMTTSVTSSMPELSAAQEHHIAVHSQCATTPEDLPTPEMADLTRTDSQIILPKPTPIKKEVRFETDYQDSLPRSKSYAGRNRNGRGKRNNGGKRRHRKYSAENTRSHESKRIVSPSTSTHGATHGEDSDASSVCSTCSSSSSSSDEKMYELPQRRTHLGRRVVPNDALACARQRKQQHDLTDKDNKNCIIS